MTPVEAFKKQEPSINPEIIRALENFSSYWHGHGYQPWRRLWFSGDEKPVYDITGEGATKNGHTYPYGWNQLVTEECYSKLVEPILQRFDGHEESPPLTDNPFFSFHLFGSIRGFIKKKYPQVWEKLKESVQRQPIPILDPICHPIFPLLPDRIQELLIESGIRAWKKDYEDNSQKPLGFWLPETAVNQKTLDLLAKKGITFVILRRHQITAGENAPIYQLETTHGPIYALVTDNQMGDEINGGAKDAEQFYQQHLKELTDSNNPPLNANDLETIEHHHLNIKYFLNYLFSKIAKGTGGRLKRTAKMIKKGRVIDDTSWSCGHGLRHWCGEKDGTICRCTPYGPPASDQRVEERRLHYQLLRHNLDELIDSMNSLGDWHESFTGWLVDQRDALSLGDKVNFDGIDESSQPYFKTLLINIAGLQSCGWFFGDNSYEQNIPQSCIKTLKIS